MSYFSSAASDKRAFAATAAPHIKKDVGFGESFSAQRQNTYGMLEESSIKNEASTELGRFVSKQSGDRFTNPQSPDFTNDPFSALKTLQSEGLEVPEKYSFTTEDDFYADAIEKEGEKYRARQKTLSRSTGGGRVGGFVGGVAGSMDDIENIVTLPLGATGRAGIAMTALIEGGVNAGIEGVAFGPRQKLLQKMGIESDETRLGAMGFGFLGGAVLGGGARALTGPEIYRATGTAIRKMGGLRKTARVLQQSEDPTVRVQGHAIADEMAFKAQHERIVARERGSLESDAAFLEDVQAGRFDLETRVARSVERINEGTLPVSIRTSDGVTHNVEVARDVARTANLMRRYDIGEAIPLSELEARGVDISPTEIERNIIEYYDLMDARFAGREVPDEFDPVDDIDIDVLNAVSGVRPEEVAAISSRVESVKARVAEAETIRKRMADPADFGDNLSRTAREDAATQKKADKLESEAANEYIGVMSDIENMSVMTDEGGITTVEARKLIAELAEDQDFAEQIRLCGLQ